MVRWLTVLCLVLSLLAPLSAAAGGGDEVKIYRQALKLLQQGKELKACKLILKLAEFRDTPTYKKAAKKFLKYGISIKDPLGSYTIKRMVALQNELEATRAATGHLPRFGTYKRYTDGWGRPLRVELVGKRGYLYAIRSAGEDGVFFNDNDYVVALHANQAKPDKKPKSISESARQLGRGSFMHSRRLPGSGGGGAAGGAAAMKGLSSPPPPPPVGKDANKDEVEVSIEDLLKKK